MYAIFRQATKESDSRLTLEYGGDDFFIGSKGKEGTKFRMSKEQTRNHVNDIEWFYMVSQTRSYAAGDGVVGCAFGSGVDVWLSGVNECDERVGEARRHEIHTLVCVSVARGILELDYGVLQMVKSMFEERESESENPVRKRCMVVPGKVKEKERRRELEGSSIDSSGHKFVTPNSKLKKP